MDVYLAKYSVAFDLSWLYAVLIVALTGDSPVFF